MCGIGGIWHIGEQSCSEGAFFRFIDRLTHRGPDGRGVFYQPEERLWLGHRRLKILDLSEGGHQPMSYADGRYWITFNGEIYNFLELREELAKEGASFRTRSDTEVILAAYAHWGEACQLKFNGMWAFAIWDDQAKELFLSRDRFGVKPLHYIHNDRFVAFASEMKAFLALEGFERTFDETALQIALRDPSALEATPHCLFRGVKRLLAGQSARMQVDGTLQLRQWWNTLDHLEAIPDRYEEQVARFKELFLDACRLRMRSDVPIATAVSGGLDSSSVLSSIVQITKGNVERCAPNWQTAFVAHYPGTEQDESRHAAAVIRHCQVKAVNVELSSDTLVRYFDQALYSLEEIFEVPIGPWLLYRAFRENHRVISIDGHGADELLGGYYRQIHDHLKRSVNHLPTFFATGEIVRNLAVNPLSRWAFYADLAKKGAKRLLPQKREIFLKAEYLQGNALKIGIDQEALSRRLDPFTRELYIDFHHRTLPAILRNFDRCSMAHGVEIRAPFLDYRLVCYSFSLPSSAKMGGGYTKKILRDAMKGILPELTRLRRSKVGFACPMKEWLTQGLKPFVLDIVNSRSFLSSPFWKGEQVRSLVETAYARSDFTTLREAFDLVVASRLMDVLRK